jgi:hypothetical protein
MADYIPRADANALNWFRVFKAGTSANASVYQLSQPDADLIASVVDAFAAAYAVSSDPARRNVGTIDRKFAARFNAERVCRHFAQLIKLNLGTSDGDKALIGVPTINNAKSRVTCPLSSPTIIVVAATNLAHTLRYHDSLSPTVRAKPHGAQALQLHRVIDDENAYNPDDARYVGNFASNPICVQFDHRDRGKQATYFARWSGRRNEVGQWSLPVSMTIAA